MSKLPWNERVNVISINPVSAEKEEITRLISDRINLINMMQLMIGADFHPEIVEHAEQLLRGLDL